MNREKDGAGGRATASLHGIQWAQTIILAAVVVLPVLICLILAIVEDPDIWWHLRTGEWIWQHHAVPWTDSFSSFGAGKSWAAYSWLFELIVYQLFRRMGLVGLVSYSASMVALIAVAMYRMVQRLQVDFSLSVLLTMMMGITLWHTYEPRPWLFSILFFTLEVGILLQVRKSGHAWELLWLPPLFALWANLHIQFIDGLVVLGIATAESLAARWVSAVRTHLRADWLGGIFLASILAPLANPYGWRIYPIARDLASQPGVLNSVGEMTAMAFRRFDDWLVLLFALAAVAVLAWARRTDFFQMLLLAFAIYVAFRSQRDAWVLVIVGGAIVAGGLRGDKENRLRLTPVFALLAMVATGVAVTAGFWVLQVNNAHLRMRLAETLPVQAVEVVKEKGWSGPLYNDYTWGGYLIWALRMPVSIDGRAALHGDKQINLNHDTWNGLPGWASDPNLQKAGLVIGPVSAPLTQLLRMDPRFELTYEDKVAAVFIARLPAH
ncbi:MAG TPA: hypothetical protein VGF01_03105 [Terracidiphilus sp.]